MWSKKFDCYIDYYEPSQIQVNLYTVEYFTRKVANEDIMRYVFKEKIDA